MKSEPMPQPSSLGCPPLPPGPDRPARQAVVAERHLARDATLVLKVAVLLDHDVDAAEVALAALAATTSLALAALDAAELGDVPLEDVTLVEEVPRHVFAFG